LAVATLLFLMNGLFFYILKNAAQRLGKFSKLNMIHQANVYDELLENKEQELAEILREMKRLRERKEEEKPLRAAEARDRRESGVSDFFTLLKGRYRDTAFAEGYRLLRSRSLSDREACAAAAMERIGREAGAREAGAREAARGGRSGRNPAREILALFDLDSRYRLCCLRDFDAFRILGETLTDKAHLALLAGFRETEGGGVIEFFDWLQTRSFFEAPEIVIRSGGPGDRFSAKAPRGRPVLTEYDEGVCEGVYVIADGKTYDFSVRNGDISG
jgi:hypothetical protein